MGLTRLKTRLTHISGRRVTNRLNIVGLLIKQWLPCPLAIWAFVLDGNLVKIDFCIAIIDFVCIAIIDFVV